MPILLNDIRSFLGVTYPRRPALKRRVLVKTTNVLTNTKARDLKYIAHVDGKLENGFVEMITKYVKRNPAAEESLINICEHAVQIADTILEMSNTRTLYNAGIDYGYGEDFISSGNIKHKVTTKLSEES